MANSNVFENGKITEQITEAVEESVGSPSKGDQTSTTQTALMAIMFRKIEDHELDLRTLLDRFHASGLAEHAKSWVGIGENAKLAAHEVERVLGPKDLERISKEAGIPSQEVAVELAELLPKLIDQFSPEGTLPEDSTIKEAASLLKSKIK